MAEKKHPKTLLFLFTLLPKTKNKTLPWLDGPSTYRELDSVAVAFSNLLQLPFTPSLALTRLALTSTEFCILNIETTFLSHTYTCSHIHTCVHVCILHSRTSLFYLHRSHYDGGFHISNNCSPIFR